MLIHWQSHQEYLHFLHETKVHLDSSQRTRLRLEFAPVREKLCLLNLDPVMEYLSAFYPPVGRPAKNQVQIIRSLILMVMLRFTSLTAWLLKLKADSLLAALAGCRPDSLPPLGSYFDLMDRLWPQTKNSQQTGRKDLFPKDKNGKPSIKPGKGKNLPNKHSGITDKMASYALEHSEFPFHYEKRLQQVFRLAAILPSLKDGLIPEDGLTLSGDGTCVHSHASPYGHKLCKCLENGITGCSCKRHFSDPDAHWGWDIRLYTPVPRGTEEYKQIYNNRTSCERVNNRVLNDYHLHDMGIHTRKRYSFFTMIICICIHLDARLKKRTRKES